MVFFEGALLWSWCCAGVRGKTSSHSQVPVERLSWRQQAGVLEGEQASLVGVARSQPGSCRRSLHRRGAHLCADRGARARRPAHLPQGRIWTKRSPPSKVRRINSSYTGAINIRMWKRWTFYKRFHLNYIWSFLGFFIVRDACKFYVNKTLAIDFLSQRPWPALKFEFE